MIIENIPLYLAPLAGVGDRAFREVVSQFGADGFFTEMISAKAVTFRDRKTFQIADAGADAHPLFLQLFGSEPEILARAAATFAERGGIEGFDLNMGCPVPKITGNGEGSALMKTPRLCFDLVSALVRATPLPVSVKMRIGWDAEHLNAPEIARLCEAAGAVRITVHGRTRTDLYRPGTVRIEEIRRVVEAVSIPVIANGDIRDGESAQNMVKETGCAGLMIGRAALGAPWIFAGIRAALRGEKEPEVDRKAVMRRHVELAFRYKPYAAAGELRTHMAHYLRGFRGAASLRAASSEASSPEDYFALISKLP